MAKDLRHGASLLSPTAALRRRSIRRGVLGGSRTWTVLAVVLWGGRIVRRVIVRQETLVTREVLAPGQELTVRARPAEPSRRASRRASRRSRG